MVQQGFELGEQCRAGTKIMARQFFKQAASIYIDETIQGSKCCSQQNVVDRADRK